MPRTVKQNEEIQERRREEILAAALKVFSHRGLGAARISDIAGEAKISQGLLYRYFPSKEKAYNVVIERAFTQMNWAAESLVQSPGPAHKKIILAMEELLESLEKSKRLARTIMLIAEASSKGAPEEANKTIARESRRPYDIMEVIFRQGQEEGTIYRDDPQEQALLFWVAIKGLAMHRISQGKNYRSPHIETILRLFVKKTYRMAKHE